MLDEVIGNDELCASKLLVVQLENFLLVIV